ncbi:MAG: peptidylprolyl isomerase [Treponema sp.]|nr:peptidylprolyl isomerase [Treponema sp.]
MENKVKKPRIQEEESGKSEIIRRFKANPAIFIGTVVVLIIVIVAFVFVPAYVPSAGGGGADLTFGYYEKEPITYRPGSYFARMYEYYNSQMRGNYGADDAYFVNFQVWQNAYQAAVIHTAILQEMKKTGYEPPNSLVDREVALQYMASYRQENDAGKLALWRSVKETITTEKYLQDQYELIKPAGEEEFVVSMVVPQRRFEGTSFNLQSYPETEVAAYAAQNSGLFRSIHLSRITITSGEKEARQILASVKDGTSSFEDAARNQSQDTFADRGGDVGVQMAYELATLIRDEAEREKITALKKGELSDLVNDEENWMFFRAEEDPIPVDTADSSQLEKIRSYILLFERGRMDDYFIRKAEELRAKAAVGGTEGFSAAVEEAELKKFSFGPLPVNYGNLEFFPRLEKIETFSDTVIASFAASDSFWLAAFSTPLGAISEPLVLGDQVLLLLPLEEAEPEEYTAEASRAGFQYYVQLAAQNINPFFTQNPKFQDQFWQTYSRYFIGE